MATLKKLTDRKPLACPTPQQVSNAQQTLHEWSLHYHQLLHFTDPSLSASGGRGWAPFEVSLVKPHYHWQVLIKCVANPEFNFHVPNDFREGVYADQEAADAWVLDVCRRIQAWRHSPTPKLNQHYCCPFAVTNPCVCAYSYKCELHTGDGGIHIGTHD